ncbi:MAG TPA: efflux RND transporter periplasmic adaptor subunit [Gammaproteobacteria bacterium]|nr:efflux RND transporter periplasmic adaptor subunit [Gammaproteobacteria bacterium]
MAKRMTIMLVGVIVLFGGVLGWHFFGPYIKFFLYPEAFAAMRPPPPSVATMVATNEAWQPTLSAIGSLRAVQGVDVTTEIGGLVQKIDFKSGDHVKAGDLLVQLRIVADKAALQGLEAAEKLAELNYQRDQTLIKKHAISASQLQQDRSKLASAKAAVAQQKADIEKKTINAPFSGELGVRQVDLGQYVSPGTKVVTLQSLHPLYVEFSLPQGDINKVRNGQKVVVTVDAYPGVKFVGEVNAIEPKVNRATRNFNVQATVPNKDERLRPGMFANVDVLLPEKPQYVTLPRTAVSYNPFGDYVFIVQPAKDKQGKPVVGKDGKPVLEVQQHVVRTGPTRGDQVAILKGVEPGQKVVVAGQLKLRDGARVNINNKVLPPNDPTPDVPNT